MAWIKQRPVAEKGSATMTFTMSENGDEWLIDGVRYDSPLLQSLSACPKCGKAATQGGKFCTNCGTGIGASAGAASPADETEDEEGAESPASEEGF